MKTLAPGRLGPSRSSGSLGRSPRQPNPVSSTLVEAMAAAGVTPAASSPLGVSHQEAVQGCRRYLEDTAKEIKRIQAQEKDAKWAMAREQKREREAEAAAVDKELRDWRGKQADEMRQYVADKAQQARLQETRESKLARDFARERKATVRESERRCAEEGLLYNKENSLFQAQRAQEVSEQDKEVACGRYEDRLNLRQARLGRRQQAKLEEDSERMSEQSLEMAHLVAQMARQRAQALESLGYVRSRLPTPRRGASGGATARRRP